MVHGLLTAALNDARRRLNGPFEGLQQNLPLLLGGNADNPVNHAVFLLRRTGADLDPGKILGSQMGDNALDAVVSPGRAAGPDPELPHWEGHVVENHQHMVRGNLIELSRLPDRLTGEIHIGLRLHHQTPRPGEFKNMICGLELYLVQLHAFLLRQ